VSLATRLLAASGGSGGFAPPRYLRTTDTITTTKNGSNPTFNFDSVPENVVLVGSTYWCVYQGDWAGGNWDVRLASSSDPAGPWTEYGSNPILTRTTSGWENVGTSPKMYAPEIMEHEGTFYLYYGACDASDGSDGKIGVATASAITGPYTKYGSNPILSTGTAGAWDSLRVGEPSVVYFGGQFVMAYMGEDTDATYQASEKVGIATASDPLGPWTKASGNPLVDFGTSGQWDDALIADPCLFVVGSTLWMMYAGGLDSVPTTNARQGLAYATDPTGSWTRHPSNPILPLGSGGSWEDVWVFRGGIIFVDGAYHLIYAGYDGANMKGGNAVLDFA